MWWLGVGDCGDDGHGGRKSSCGYNSEGPVEANSIAMTFPMAFPRDSGGVLSPIRENMEGMIMPPPIPAMHLIAMVGHQDVVSPVSRVPILNTVRPRTKIVFLPTLSEMAPNRGENRK